MKLKRLIKLTEDYHKKIGSSVCIGFEVWTHESGNKEIEWNLWDGTEMKRFKKLAEIEDVIREAT